ncbi:MAG: sporulation protein [Gammaproteobacteria bacterium RIFCSPHIGHO2_12_FULL_43_28]|nr:MAG: sporulation protein [Gammaproteobacteria bacterium RIFCSPHIGHO2_12_FULL_43_28]
MRIPHHLRSSLRCVSFCTAAGYDLIGLAGFFKKKGYQTRISRDVVHVASQKKPGDIFFFDHGSFVVWGYKKPFEEKLLSYVVPYSRGPLRSIESDHFIYSYGDSVTIDTHERSRFDIITLDSQDSQIKLAISYGLAQSIKLESFEEEVQQTIKQNSALPEEIITRGVVSLSRRDIFKRMGNIFLARSSINLNAEYLGAPEFFWRNPSLEPFYEMVKKFLDIPSRVMSLNQKLDVLQELFDILNSQLQHRHSSLLESIIILLIAVEIIISLFQFHMA